MDDKYMSDEELMAEGERLANELGVTVAQLRFHMDPRAKGVMCNSCVYRQKYKVLKDGEAAFPPACEAFPAGIPRELLYRREHDTPFPGDGGYRYKPVDATE